MRETLRTGSPDHNEQASSWAGFIRWGGWSLSAAAVMLVVFVAGVIATGQELPVPAREALDSPGTPMALFVVAAIGEVLLAPGAIALYLALKRFDPSRMLLATVFLLLATPMFLASRGPVLSLTQLGDNYRDATDESARAGYLAAAEFGIDLQNTYSTMAVILLSLGTVIAGTVMLTSAAFGRPIAYIAIAAGALSIFTPFVVITGGPEGIAFVGLALGGVWQLVVGIKLARGHWPDTAPRAATRGRSPALHAR